MHSLLWLLKKDNLLLSLLSILFIIFSPIMLLSQSAVADTGVIYGSTGNSDGGRLITIDKTTGNATAINTTGANNLPGLAITSAGQIFAVDGSEMLYKLDAVSADTMRIGIVDINFLPAIAFDHNDDLYGLGEIENDRWYLFKIDTISAAFEALKPISFSTSPDFGRGWRGMSFNPADGNIFASTEDGDIHIINPQNGKTQLLGNVGIGRIPDLAFDNNGELFASVNGNSGFSLAQVNTTDGSASVIGNTGISSISGLSSRTLPLSGPQIGTFPRSVDYGLKGLGGFYRQNITLRNVGTDEVSISSISVDAPFSIEDIVFPLLLDPKTSYMLEVTFAPTEANSYAQNITLATNDPDNSEIIIPLFAESTTATPGVLFGIDGEEGILLDIDPATGESDTLFVIIHDEEEIDYVTEIEFRSDGTMFVARGDGYEELYTVNTLNMETRFLGNHPRRGVPGMDFGPDGKLYGAYYDSGPDSTWLVIIDQDNGAFEYIGKSNYEKIRGLTFDANGTLYGVGPDTTGGDTSDVLIKIDPQTGLGIKVGQTGFQKVAALEFGPDSVLYAGISLDRQGNLGGSLITIDPQTGQGTWVGNTAADALTGLSFFPDLTLTSIEKNEIALARNFELQQNYPNPFNPSTTIRFSLDRAMDVSLKVYNISGQLVKTLISWRMQGGSHVYNWNASDLSSGLYFYQLQASGHAFTKKALLVK